MAAITSQTFHHTPSFGLSGIASRVAEAAGAAARLLGRALTTTPAAVAARRRVDEAEAVRRLADAWLDVDPGFASDLYAAAARHEDQARH